MGRRRGTLPRELVPRGGRPARHRLQRGRLSAGRTAPRGRTRWCAVPGVAARPRRLRRTRVPGAWPLSLRLAHHGRRRTRRRRCVRRFPTHTMRSDDMTQDTAQSTGGCACGGGGCGSQQTDPAVDRGDRTELTGAKAPATASAAQPGDLDVREIEPAHRHARVIGQVSALVPGEVVVVAAPHAPERLLVEIDADVPGDFTFEYL